MREGLEEKKRNGWMPALSSAPARRAAAFGARWAMGFFLAQSVLFGSYAPFGTAFAAAEAAGPGRIPALLGAASGYAFLFLRGYGARSFASCVLVGLLAPLLRRFLSPEKEAFAPLLAFLASAAAAFPGVWAEKENATAWILGGAELILVTFGAGIFRAGTSGEEEGERRTGARFLILMAAAAAFSPVTAAGVSVGRSLLVFLCLFRLGEAPSLRVGAASGAAAGAFSDASAGFTPFFTLTMAFGGLFAALFRRFGKALGALAFVTAGAAATVWAHAAGGETYGLASLLEYAAGAVLFLIFPGKWRKAAGIFSPGSAGEPEKREEDLHAAWLRDRTGDALFLAAEAYGEAAAGTRGAKRNFSEELIVPALRDKICASCPERSRCVASHAAEEEFRRLKKTLEEENDVKEDGLSAEFGGFCPSGASFARELSRLWYAARVQKSYNARINESIGLLADEYEEMASLLGKLSQKVREDAVFDRETEDKIEKELFRRGIRARVIAAGDMRGRLSLEITGEDLGELPRKREEFEALLFSLTGRKYTVGREVRKGRERSVAAREAPRFSFEVGAASRRKKGSHVNGDYGSWFLFDDRLYLLLSDGMGSGEGAKSVSTVFGGMTETLIRGGVAPEDAIAAAVRSRLLSEGMVSATADLLEADLINGRLAFYKCAAPPSYIKGAEGVRRTAGGGLYGGQTCVSFDEAKDGEVILMVTDGVEDGLTDGEFVRAVSETPGEDPQALCEALLKKSMKKNGAMDDGSVAAVRLKKAE